MGFLTPKSFNIKIPIEISARHVHLNQKDLEVLFGVGHKLRKLKQLTQPADFAAEETVSIKNNLNILENVRVVGPLRENTQVEISRTDAIYLHVDAPVRLSGDIKNSSGITIIGPKGHVDLKEGLIVAQRHIHCATDEEKKLRLKNGDEISVKVEGERPITFHKVKIRVRDDYKLCLHLDTDEGNACSINKSGIGEIL